MKINSQDIDVDLKIKAMELCGINEIHEHIKFKDGHFDIDLQIGHPNQADSVKGCYFVHLLQLCLKLSEHYNSMLPCAEDEVIQRNLKDCIDTCNSRSLRRQLNKTLHTDKEE